jgi:hypothetical protein
MNCAHSQQNWKVYIAEKLEKGSHLVNDHINLVLGEQFLLTTILATSTLPQDFASCASEWLDNIQEPPANGPQHAAYIGYNEHRWLWRYPINIQSTIRMLLIQTLINPNSF